MNLFLTTSNTGKEDDAECRFKGTERCPIHNGVGGCFGCEVMKAIVSKLYCFEKIYYDAMEVANENI